VTNGYTGSVDGKGFKNPSPIPFVANLQPGLYWTSAIKKIDASAFSFSFNSGEFFSNTTADNYLHVLPMARGWFGGGTAPAPGSGLVSTLGGLAVYDSDTGCTWAADANLAATPTNNFSVTGMTSIMGGLGTTLQVPMLAPSGTMLWSTAAALLTGMNSVNYGGVDTWLLPDYPVPPQTCGSTGACACGDLQTLSQHLKVVPGGDQRLMAMGSVLGFQDLQPANYWSCPQDMSDMSTQAQCSDVEAGLSPMNTPMWFNFNFDTGFEGTTEETKHFYVMVYWPSSPSMTSPPDSAALP
jgi:hypothetical protein